MRSRLAARVAGRKGNVARKVKVHNPHHLTDEQVGVSEGYRLLNEGEVKNTHKIYLHEIEVYVPHLRKWDDKGWRGSVQENTYRTKLSVKQLKELRQKLRRLYQKKPHNPDNLTDEQVGISEGYRLLNEDEIGPSDQVSCDGFVEIEWYNTCDSVWDKTGWCGSVAQHTYRTKLTPKQLEKLKNETSS